MSNIVRVKKRENPFVMIDKTGLHDVKLSWKAKGLLAYLISLPDDWKVHERELATHSKDGRDSTRAALKELMENGYVVRRQLRNDDEGKKGQFAKYETIVYEVPIDVPKERENEQKQGENEQNEKKNAAVGFSDHGETDRGKPDFGKPDFGKPDHTNKELDLKKTLLNVSTTTTNEHEEIKNDSLTEAEKELQQVFELYMQCGWGFPSSLVIQTIEHDVKDHGAEIVSYAMRIAALQNARGYKYAGTILKTWEKQNLKTLDQVKKYEEAAQKQNNRKGNSQSKGRGNNGRTQKPKIAAGQTNSRINDPFKF